jgi:hypothetical protein
MHEETLKVNNLKYMHKWIMNNWSSWYIRIIFEKCTKKHLKKICKIHVYVKMHIETLEEDGVKNQTTPWRNTYSRWFKIYAQIHEE